LVAFVEQALSVLFTALQANGWVNWVEEGTKFGETASGRDGVELSATAALAITMEDIDIFGNDDWLSARAGLGQRIVGGGTAATGVGFADSANYCTSSGVKNGGAAKIHIRCVGGGTAASAIVVGVGVDFAEAAKLVCWVEGLEAAALTVGEVAGDLEVDDFSDDKDATASTVGADSVGGTAGLLAASLGCWIESPGAAALEVVGGIGKNGSAAADLTGGDSLGTSWAASQRGANGGAACGGGNIVAYAIGIIVRFCSALAAASGEGVVDGGSAATSQSVVGVGDNSGINVGGDGAAELGGWIKGRSATAGLGCSGADNDAAGGNWANEDVVRDEVGGSRAAKINVWYEVSGATALKGDAIGNQRLNGTSTA
jgi:hypothetical protein